MPGRTPTSTGGPVTVWSGSPGLSRASPRSSWAPECRDPGRDEPAARITADPEPGPRGQPPSRDRCPGMGITGEVPGLPSLPGSGTSLAAPPARNGRSVRLAQSANTIAGTDRVGDLVTCDPASLSRCVTAAGRRRRAGSAAVMLAASRSMNRRKLLPVGSVAKAPVTAAVQPVIKREGCGRGGRPGPHAGLWHGARLEIDSWQRAMGAGVVR
jgi:hypothetical protein